MAVAFGIEGITFFDLARKNGQTYKEILFG